MGSFSTVHLNTRRIHGYIFLLILLFLPLPSFTASGETPAKAPLLLIDSQPVYWTEFRFWLNYIESFYKSSHGYETIPDWSVKQGGKSLRDFFLSTAVQYACNDRAIEALAKENHFELSKDDLEKIEETRRGQVKIYGEQEYLRVVESMYGSEDQFKYLTRIDLLGNSLFESLYGAKGEKCTDACVSQYVTDHHLMAVQFIFLSGSGSDGKALRAEELEKKDAVLKEILSQLHKSSDPQSLFINLVNKYSEDKSFTDFPEGILFASGSKGKDFESAYLSLKEHEYSGIVKTGEGSYILLRVPVSAEMKVDISGNNLRYWAAYRGLFKSRIDERCAAMKIEYKDGYDKINVEKILPY